MYILGQPQCYVQIIRTTFHATLTFMDVAIRATPHTSQEPFPSNCESPNQSAQMLSQHTSKIV